VESPRSVSGNQLLMRQPDPAELGDHYLYRESPWIDRLIRGSFAVIGVALGLLAVLAATNTIATNHSIIMVIAGALVCAAIYLRNADPINFICARSGLYFPEFSNLSRTPGRWLHVPWKNVREYRAQRMLDETSSRGILLAISASPEEERSFFSGRTVFKLSALRHLHGEKIVQVGYSTFLPRPEEVLAQLRSHEAAQRSRLDGVQLATDGLN
jgi:hypothetical protein